MIRIAALIVMLQQIACIAYQGHHLEDVEGSFPKVRVRPQINFSNKVIHLATSGAEEELDQNPLVRGNMLKRTKLFRTVQALKGREQYHFEFRTLELDDTRSFWAKLWRFSYASLATLSVGLIPYFDEDERILEVRVYQQNVLMRQYRFVEGISKAASFFMLPWLRGGWTYSEETMKAIDTKLVNHFLQVFYRDFIAPVQPKSKSKDHKPQTSA